MDPEGEQAENQQAENQQAENQQAPAAASIMATSAASINSQVPLPPNFVTTGDLASQWKKYKQIWDSFEIVTGLKEKTSAYRTATFITCIGSEALEIFNGLPFENEEDKNDIDKVLELFQNYCIGETNVIYERYIFNNRVQESGESFDSFVSHLRLLSLSCNYNAMREEMIRDRIVMGISDARLRRSMLQEPKLTLKTAIERGRASETTTRQLKTMAPTEEVSAVRKKGKAPSHRTGQTSSWPKNCKYCGRSHPKDKSKCPAYGKTCTYCSKKNHFESMCMAKKNQVKGNPRMKKVNLCDESEDSDSQYEYVETVNVDTVNAATMNSYDDTKLFTNMRIQQKTVRFQIDTGATVNVIGKSLVPSKCTIEPTTTKLKVYNNTTLTAEGKTRIPMKNLKNNRKYSVACIVVNDDKVQPILGLRAAKQMNLITVNTENIAAISSKSETKPLTVAQITSEYPSLFDGKLGLIKDNVDLKTDSTVKPVQNPIRRVPHALMDSLKAELDRLRILKVIESVSEPTEWLSSLVTVKKPSGKIRTCIDPQPLNAALKRAPLLTPILDDVLPKLEGSKIFSVIDVKDGYWNLRLSKEASYLTTTSTPFGNIRFLRLPFGLKVSSELFQSALNEALHGLNGVHIIADDILVVGKGDSDDAATHDHDKNLRALLQRCVEKSIKLNKDKIKLGRKEVPYMGNTLTPGGLKADKSKINAIVEMPPPNDIKGVRRLMGMANYLMRFLPNLSSMLEPIRKLTLKDVKFEWTEEQQKAFEDIKEVITSTQVLKFFDPKNTNLMLQTDSSRSGLGAVLLQDNRPVGFGSRSLTSSEKNYAQIELELLAVIFGLQHFHQMTYGRHVEVQTDHKPLENIAIKPLIKAPRRLQRMLLQMQDYNTTIVYRKGSDLYVPDTLSRASLQETTGPSADRHTHVFYLELDSINLTETQELKDEKLHKIKQATMEDKTLQILKQTIIHGWPEQNQLIPMEIAPYQHEKHNFTVQDGIIFVGDRVVIPSRMRKEIIQDIHLAHAGIESCLRTAREYVYWPQMSAQIKEHCQKCDTCRATDDNSQQKETLISHEIPERPWQHISTDIFTLDGVNYLITLDQYSNFWEVDKIATMTAKTVIHKLKHHFARYGICQTLISDNAPIFHSAEFKQFEKLYKFHHKYTSPYHQSANPAERAVKTCKNLMKKAKTEHQDIYLALLLHRNIPMQAFNSSPAQKFLGRRTKTTIPTKDKLLQPKTVDPTVQKERTQTHRAKQQFYYNRSAKDLHPLKNGDTVRMQPLVNKKADWEKGTVIRKSGERSYEVLREDDMVLRRNRKHLKKTQEDPGQITQEDNYIHATPQTQLPAINLEADVTHLPKMQHTPPKSPKKSQPRRSARERHQFTPYEHIP